MNKRVSTLTGRRNDPFPGRLNLCLEDRSLVHVLSGLRLSDLALPREAQTIEARQDSDRRRFALLRLYLMDWMDMNATSLTSDLMASMQ
jgi:hypothetical protein